MNETPIASWSRALPTTTRLAEFGAAETQTLAAFGRPFIPRGAGRSFSDAAYLTAGVTLSSRRLAGIGELDQRRGRITCGAGVAMVDLHRRLEATGFSFPVYGGTQLATIGGGVASDIHGKNHVAAGSFGHHLEAVTLETADGRTVKCSREERPELFAATVGGMGLTGLIKEVELRLQQGRPRTLHVESHVVPGISAARQALSSGECDFQFCSWGRVPGPGVCYRAFYVDRPSAPPAAGLDLWLPRLGLLNGWSLSAAELLRRVAHRNIDKDLHVRSFNYSAPHERLIRWNRLYGRRGFIEYHLALAEDRFDEIVEELLARSRRSAVDGLYVVVVKQFGRHPSEGYLSFPCPGCTLNFQLVNRPEIRAFLREFTEVVIAAGGRLYLAKDSCMRADQFERMYPDLARWREVVRRWDPHHRVRSDLSQRLAMKPW